MQRRRKIILRILKLFIIPIIFVGSGFFIGQIYWRSLNNHAESQKQKSSTVKQETLQKQLIKMLIEEAKNLDKATFSEKEFESFELSNNLEENVLFDSESDNFLNFKELRKKLLPFLVEDESYEAFFSRVDLFRHYKDEILKIFVKKELNSREYTINIVNPKNNINEKIVIAIKEFNQKIPIDTSWFTEELFSNRLSDRAVTKDTLQGIISFESNQNFKDIDQINSFTIDGSVKHHEKLIMKSLVRNKNVTTPPQDKDYNADYNLIRVFKNQNVFIKLFLKDQYKRKWILKNNNVVKIDPDLENKLKIKKDKVLDNFLRQVKDEFHLLPDANIEENTLNLQDLKPDFYNKNRLIKYSINHEKITKDKIYKLLLKASYQDKDDEPMYQKEKYIDLKISGLNSKKKAKIKKEIETFLSHLKITSLSETEFKNLLIEEKPLENTCFKELGFQNTFFNFDRYKDDVDILIKKEKNSNSIDFTWKYKFVNQEDVYRLTTSIFDGSAEKIKKLIEDIKKSEKEKEKSTSKIERAKHIQEFYKDMLLESFKTNLEIDKEKQTLKINEKFKKEVIDNNYISLKYAINEGEEHTYSSQIENLEDEDKVKFSIGISETTFDISIPISGITDAKIAKAKSFSENDLEIEIRKGINQAPIQIDGNTNLENYFLEKEKIPNYDDILNTLVQDYKGSSRKILITKTKEGDLQDKIQFDQNINQEIFVYFLDNEKKYLIKKFNFVLTGLDEKNDSIKKIKKEINSENFNVENVEIVNLKSWKDKISKSDIRFVSEQGNLQFILEKSSPINEQGETNIEFKIQDLRTNLESILIKKTVKGFEDKNSVLKGIIQNALNEINLKTDEIFADNTQDVKSLVPSKKWFDYKHDKIKNYINKKIMEIFDQQSDLFSKYQEEDIKKLLEVDGIDFLENDYYKGTIKINISFAERYNLTKTLSLSNNRTMNHFLKNVIWSKYDKEIIKKLIKSKFESKIDDFYPHAKGKIFGLPIEKIKELVLNTLISMIDSEIVKFYDFAYFSSDDFDNFVNKIVEDNFTISAKEKNKYKEIIIKPLFEISDQKSNWWLAFWK